MADGTVSIVINALNNTGKTLQEIKQNFGSVGKIATGAGSSVQNFGKSMFTWGKSGVTGKMAVAGLTTATGLLTAAIPSAIKRIDTLNNSNRVFANMGFKAKDTGAAMKYLQKGIQGLPTPLDEAVNGLQMISSATGDVKVGSQVFTAMNHAILGFGGSTDQVKEATVQLSQAMSNGKIDAQTWNSMMNAQMGPTLNAMAKKMGITTGQLKDGLSSGKISVKDFEKSLTELDQKGGGGLKSLTQIAKDSTGGINTGIANMKTSITRGMADILSAFGPQNISGAISSFGSFVENTMKGVGDSIKKVMAFVKANSSWLMPIIKGAAGAAGALTALKAAAILLSPVVQTLGGGIKILGTILSVAFSPLGIIIGIIAAVGVALYAFFTKTQEGKNAFKALVDMFNTNVIPVFNKVKDAIKNAMDGAMGTMKNAGGIIQVIMQTIGDFVADHWNQISMAIGVAMDVIQAIIGQGVQLWQTLIMPVINTIVNFIRDNWNNIKTIIMTVLVIVGGIIAAAMFSWQNAIFPAILAIANTVALVFNNIMGVIGDVLDLIVGIINLFVNIFTGKWREAFYSLGDIMDAAWAIVANLFMGLLNIFVGIFQAAWALIETGVNIFFSIVAAIMTVGWNVVNSIVVGLLNIIVAVIKSIWDGIVFVIKGAIWLITSFIKIEITGWTIIITAIMNAIKFVFVNTWNGIKSVISVVVNAIKVVITTVWNVIKGVTSTVFNVIKAVASSVWNGIRSVISGAINGVRSVVSNGVNAVMAVWNRIRQLASTAANAFGQVVSNVRNGIGRAVSAVTGKVSEMLSAGKNFVMGFVNGIAGAIGGAVNAAANMAKRALNAAKHALGIHSPSREMATVGMYTAMGMANGIDNNVYRVENAMTQMANGAINAVQDAGIGDAVDSAFDVSPTLQGLAKGTITAEGVIKAQAGSNNGAVNNSAVNTANTVNNNFAAGAFVVRNDNDIQKISDQLAWNNTKQTRGGLAFG
ncbi:tape measure protein [Leuconostoc pseudomesenteroides]|uniref:tape measure protein n=1 Tax=Leuconostoc pseudomesenteroides TaxID=33968 RepID=UPI00403DA388